MRRRQTIVPLLSALLLAAALPAMAQDWRGRGRVQGIVTDQSGEPVQGAKVTLMLDGIEGRGPEPLTTNRKGRWSMLGLATGSWTIVIEAEGFKTAEGAARIISEGVGPGETIRVTLNPIPKEVLEKAENEGPTAMIERGNALLLEQRYAEARAEYEEAIAAIEDVEYHPPILRAIANTYYAEEQAEKAIETLKHALELAPADQETLKLISTLLVNEGREEEAQQYMALITEEFTLDPNSLLNLGIEAFNAGDTEKAAEYFERVVAENPDYPDAYYYRGLIYLGQGKAAEAKADFEKLLELAPDHPNAAEAREFIENL